MKLKPTKRYRRNRIWKIRQDEGLASEPSVVASHLLYEHFLPVARGGSRSTVGKAFRLAFVCLAAGVSEKKCDGLRHGLIGVLEFLDVTL